MKKVALIMLMPLGLILFLRAQAKVPHMESALSNLDQDENKIQKRGTASVVSDVARKRYQIVCTNNDAAEKLNDKILNKAIQGEKIGKIDNLVVRGDEICAVVRYEN